MLLVVAYHADLPVPGGFIGVDVFFVISGFVITRLLVSELEPRGRIGFGGFYARRARRILPALATTTTVTALASVLLLSPLGPQQDTASTGLAASFMVANVQLTLSPAGYFGAPTQLNALQHTWSLSVEEQFYLVFPALLVLGWLWTRSRPGRAGRRTAAVVLLGVATASFALSFVLSATDLVDLDHPQRVAFYASPTRAWEFAVGALLFLGARRLSRVPEKAARAAGVVGLGMVVVAALVIDESVAFPGWVAVIPVAGTALVLAAGTITGRGASRLLGVGPAVIIGDLSYSWYLWHWPALVFARALWPDAGRILLLAAVAVSLAVAWVTHRLVERPLHRNTAITGRRAVALATVCVAVPATACLLVRPLSAATRSDATDDLVRAMAFHADVTSGCDDPAALADRPDRCTWTVEDPKGRIVLIGDSLAGQLTEPVVAAGNEAGYDVTVATLSACPFVSVSVDNPGHDREACDAFVTRSLGDLVDEPPALVITASNLAGHLAAAGVAVRDPATGTDTRAHSAKTALLRAGLADVGRTLTDAGIPVVAVAPLPTFPSWDPRECGTRTNFDPESCKTGRDRSDALVSRQEALELHLTAAEAGGAVAVDLADAVCTERCVTYRDGRWLYRDGNHLTVGAAESLTGMFTDLVERHAAP